MGIDKNKPLEPTRQGGSQKGGQVGKGGQQQQSGGSQRMGGSESGSESLQSDSGTSVNH